MNNRNQKTSKYSIFFSILCRNREFWSQVLAIYGRSTYWKKTLLHFSGEWRSAMTWCRISLKKPKIQNKHFVFLERQETKHCIEESADVHRRSFCVTIMPYQERVLWSHLPNSQQSQHIANRFWNSYVIALQKGRSANLSIYGCNKQRADRNQWLYVLVFFRFPCSSPERETWNFVSSGKTFEVHFWCCFYTFPRFSSAKGSFS